jgi:hypothetical protein
MTWSCRQRSPHSTRPIATVKPVSDDKTRYSGLNKWMAFFLFFGLRYFTPNIPVITEA